MKMVTRSFYLATLALVAFALAGNALAQDDAQALRDRVTQWQEHYDAGDMASVADLYVEDAWFGAYDGTTHQGRDAIVQFMQNPEPVAPGESTIDITVSGVEVAGDTAYLHGTYTVLDTNGEPVIAGSWLTVNERGDDGIWLIRSHLSNLMLPPDAM